MTTKKTKIKTPKLTIESLQNEIELLRYELYSLKEVIKLPFTTERSNYLKYQISFIPISQPHEDTYKVKIIGQSFSTPSLGYNPIIYQQAIIYVEITADRRNNWRIKSIHKAEIDLNGQFNIDIEIPNISINRNALSDLRIKAVDTKTGFISNNLFPFN